MPLTVRVIVVRTRDGSPVVPGWSVDLQRTRIVIGRAVHANVRLDDETVSFEHVAIDARSEPLTLTNLSARGVTRWERVTLSAQQAVTLPLTRCHVQVGGILLAIEPQVPTLEYELDLMRPVGDALLQVVAVGENTLFRVEGQALRIAPAPGRLLRLLARRPCALVPTDVLVRELGLEEAPQRLNQVATYARQAFREAIDRALIGRERLVERVVASGALETDEPTDRALLGALIQNRRGRGYQLNLPSGDVTSVRG